MLKPKEEDIIANKKAGRIYVADFNNDSGKYISLAEYGSEEAPDVDVKISPKINLRVTYLTNDEKISGVEISKLFRGKLEKIHFSTLDFEKILQLLKLFSELDLKSIANKSIILDESIIGDSDEVSSFLTLIAADPEGKEKFSEVANNFGLIGVGDIDYLAQRKECVELFDRILNFPEEFESYKTELDVGKPEEVWQQFFSQNSWILGTDFVEVLDERRVDVDNITDYLLKSFDGFVDIVELKLPDAEFWTADNMPRSDLTKASMQCNRYILQTERKINDLEFNKKINKTPIVKPRITLIYGRSSGWTEDEKEAYRVLNSSYTNLSILTYDHLLARAKRMIGIIESKTVNELETGKAKEEETEIPF